MNSSKLTADDRSGRRSGSSESPGNISEKSAGGRIAYLCLQATKEGQASHAHVHEIIRGLEQCGYHIDLYEPSYVQSTRLPGPFGRLIEFYRVQQRLRASELRPKAVYIRSHFATLPAAAWARRHGIPVVQEVNGPYEDALIAWPSARRFMSIIKWLTRTQLRWADAVIAVTPGLKSWIEAEIAHPAVTVVSNGANIESLHPNATTEIELPDSYAVFTGSLASWQGIDSLLGAVRDPAWPKELYLVIVGEGQEGPKVEEAARQDSRVVPIGKQPYRTVPGIIAGSIAGIIPKNDLGGRSVTGLSPLKLYETLACGVPAIVTDFPGQAELIRENDCGTVVPPSSPEAIAQSVSYLFEHPEVRNAMGIRGREAIVRDHSWNQRATVTANVIAEALKV